ncbi:PTS glucose transporter subunit IIA [Alkalihalobacillus sp. 1P02AB]|uniref:PTS sugar transporter subunit IIA n=1 Tax=Alkalihalobacillus sp. 1P02AB TaxID=3132260 RepID=UPI0039A56516
MFLKGLFKKEKQLKVYALYAPMNGEILPLEQVPDPVFSQKMMGEGFSIIPSDGEVVAPVTGKVIQVAPTKHAIGLITDEGIEVLIHVGLETVALKGEGFTVHVSEGEEVTVGQSLLTVNLSYIKEHAKSEQTIVVITNTDESKYVYESVEENRAILGKTVVMNIQEKQ